MAEPLPKRPRTCTHIKVTGQRCGSPALRGEFFCYFHTRLIKGVQQRVDMQLHPIALLEDHEAIQLSIMHVVDGLWKGTLEPTRARLIIQALRIAARNAVHARFDDCYYEDDEQKMVREVPNYAHQYLIEHPEFGPPFSSCGAGAPAREAASKQAADESPVSASPESAIASQESAPAHKPVAERQQNAAQSATCGSRAENNSAPKERKNHRENPELDSKEYDRIKQAEAAIPGAMQGNWRDLRTVFEFAGITEQSKEAPS